MNNSKIVLDDMSLSLEEKVDNTEHLRERDSELVRIIEAITRINQSDDWNVLKSHIFDGELDSLEKRLKSESENLILNVPQINYIQGKISWARKYAELDKLASSFRIELSNIRKLTPPTER